jgi:hypothetical protein
MDKLTEACGDGSDARSANPVLKMVDMFMRDPGAHAVRTKCLVQNSPFFTRTDPRNFFLAGKVAVPLRSARNITNTCSFTQDSWSSGESQRAAVLARQGRGPMQNGPDMAVRHFFAAFFSFSSTSASIFSVLLDSPATIFLFRRQGFRHSTSSYSAFLFDLTGIFG